MPAGLTADARRTSRRRRSAGRLTPPRSAGGEEPLISRTNPSEVAPFVLEYPSVVVSAPLRGRTDAHTERVIIGDDKILIAIIIDKYIYNQMSRRAMQPKG